jgi:hypothetical protein
MTNHQDSASPYTGDEPYLFVSYAREDRARVQALLGRMHESGVRLWWDDGLLAGQSFADEIERRVHGSAGVVVFLSANSTARKTQNWVFEETKLAANKGKDVIPIRLDDAALPLDWKTLVEHRQMLQATDKPSSVRAIDELCGRAKTLGCGKRSAAGATDMQSNPSGFSAQNAVITALCVVVAVLLTIVFMRPEGQRSAPEEPRSSVSARPSLETPSPSSSGAMPRPSAPETPAGYVDSIKDEVRNWTWSKQSAVNSAELTLHWENCQGVEKMKSANKMSQSGTVVSIASKYGLPVRCCRFCYEIEFYRRMKNGEIAAPAGSAPSGTSAP